MSPARVAQWWACWTHDLVVVSSIAGWGDFSFRRIFASHLCRSMWEKWLVALEKKVVSTGVRKPGNTMCVADRHDVTIAVRMALNPNTTNQSVQWMLYKTMFPWVFHRTGRQYHTDEERFRKVYVPAENSGWCRSCGDGKSSNITYSITCIQRPPKGSDKSGLLQQVVFKCRFYQAHLRRCVVSEQWSLKAVYCLIQVVSIQVVSEQWPLKAVYCLIQVVSNTGFSVSLSQMTEFRQFKTERVCRRQFQIWW